MPELLAAILKDRRSKPKNNFLQDNRASGEAIGFLGVMFIIMLVVINMWSPVSFEMKKFALENVNRIALLQMEQEGGYSDNIGDMIRDKLNIFGFDESKVEVYSDTPKPVQWGDTINLTIKYTDDYERYEFNHFNYEKVVDHPVMESTRSSVSRVYHKD